MEVKALFDMKLASGEVLTRTEHKTSMDGTFQCMQHIHVCIACFLVLPASKAIGSQVLAQQNGGHKTKLPRSLSLAAPLAVILVQGDVDAAYRS